MAGLLSLLSGQSSTQPQQAPQSQGGGFSDILATLGPSLAMIDPRNQQLGAALMQVNMGRQKERKQAKAANQTAQWLQSQGLGEGEAAYLTSDPDALRGWYKEWKTGSQPDWKIQRLINKDGQEQDFMVDMKNPTRMQPLGGPKAENARDKFGNSIIWGRDKDGKWHAMQPSSGGGLQDAPPPEGIELSPPGVSNLNLGTSFGIRDRAGNVINDVPIDNAGKAAALAGGKAQGEAAFDLPRVEQNAQQTLDVLERMKTHPGREGSTGFIEGILPSRSADQVDFQSLVDQTQGQSFLQAFQMLKGAGQITDIEGRKATEAISRLGNQRLSDADYLKAISDLEEVVTRGLDRAKLQAGQGGGAAPPALNAAPSSNGWTVEKVQ